MSEFKKLPPVPPPSGHPSYLKPKRKELKTAQDYLADCASGEARGGFNSRLFGDTRLKTLDGIPQGERWGQRNAGWELADSMIMKGKIFSRTKIDGTEIEFKCYQDGNAWCCVGPNFENLQESPASFGDTREEAINAFAANDLDWIMDKRHRAPTA